MTFNIVPQAHAAAFSGDCVSNGVATITGIQCVIENILSPIPSLIALVAVGMMIFGGIKIINAGVDPKKYAAGWSTFAFAAIGLVLLSVVWLVLVMIEKYTGAPITNFGI